MIGRRSRLKLTRSDCAAAPPAPAATHAAIRSITLRTRQPRPALTVVLRRGRSAEFLGDRRNRTHFDVPVEHLGTFRLQYNGPGSHPRRQLGIDPERAVQAHDDLAVDDVNAVFAEGDELHGVPFAGRPLVVRLLDAAA